VVARKIAKRDKLRQVKDNADHYRIPCGSLGENLYLHASQSAAVLL
jgi:hypothetical protein